MKPSLVPVPAVIADRTPMTALADRLLSSWIQDCLVYVRSGQGSKCRLLVWDDIEFVIDKRPRE